MDKREPLRYREWFDLAENPAVPGLTWTTVTTVNATVLAFHVVPKFHDQADVEFFAVTSTGERLRLPPDRVIEVSENSQSMYNFIGEWRLEMRYDPAVVRPSPGAGGGDPTLRAQIGVLYERR